MEMIHNYQDFCREYDIGNTINPDTGTNGIRRLKAAGWKLRFWHAKTDLLALCRHSEECFQLAYTDVGVDFWIKS